METIEIRQNKKTVIPLLVLFTAALFGIVYYIYFSGKIDSNTIKTVYVFLTASLIYAIYIPTKKLLKNEPVLVFSKSEIEINEKGKPVTFLWPQILEWWIEKDDDGGTHYLTIVTADTKKKINISWLDKLPSEIDKLLREYKPR